MKRKLALLLVMSFCFYFTSLQPALGKAPPGIEQNISITKTQENFPSLVMKKASTEKKELIVSHKVSIVNQISSTSGYVFTQDIGYDQSGVCKETYSPLFKSCSLPGTYTKTITYKNSLSPEWF